MQLEGGTRAEARVGYRAGPDIDGSLDELICHAVVCGEVLIITIVAAFIISRSSKEDARSISWSLHNLASAYMRHIGFGEIVSLIVSWVVLCRRSRRGFKWDEGSDV